MCLTVQQIKRIYYSLKNFVSSNYFQTQVFKLKQNFWLDKSKSSIETIHNFYTNSSLPLRLRSVLGDLSSSTISYIKYKYSFSRHFWFNHKWFYTSLFKLTPKYSLQQSLFRLQQIKHICLK